MGCALQVLVTLNRQSKDWFLLDRKFSLISRFYNLWIQPSQSLLLWHLERSFFKTYYYISRRWGPQSRVVYIPVSILQLPALRVSCSFQLNPCFGCWFFIFCWILNTAQRFTSTIFFYGAGVAFSGSQFYSTPSFICRTTIPSSSVLFWYHGLHRKKACRKRCTSILDWSFSKMQPYHDIHPKFSFIWNITRRLFDNWRFFI